MRHVLRIGTRDSQLAVWQATQVQNHLNESGVASELVFIKSEGDKDTVTPIYQLGVQGVFTRTLDAALLNGRIDLAVHSLKDVPTIPANGIRQAAVLKRASYKDILVYKEEAHLASLGYVNGQWSMSNSETLTTHHSPLTVATSSIRRRAQWLHRYPQHKIENLRGNVNTRLRKLYESDWDGAIFAAAGLERIGLRPPNAVDLDWMLPAPAQGAITVVCREEDDFIFDACQSFNDFGTALCTAIERDFLRTLMGGCSTPISALAEIKGEDLFLKGNIFSPDGKRKAEMEKTVPVSEADDLGRIAANELLYQHGQFIAADVRAKRFSANGEA